MKKTKKPALKRVRFTYEALCLPDVDAECMSILDVARECDSGEMSGLNLGVEVKLLTLQQAAHAVGEHCSEKFDLAAFEDGQRVWWTDPDEGHSSGWWTIVEYDGGGIYNMKNTAGGECQACGHELSEHPPKKGKKWREYNTKTGETQPGDIVGVHMSFCNPNCLAKVRIEK